MEGVHFTGGGEADLEKMDRNMPTVPGQPSMKSGGPVMGPDMDGTPNDMGRSFDTTTPS